VISGVGAAMRTDWPVRSMPIRPSLTIWLSLKYFSRPVSRHPCDASAGDGQPLAFGGSVNAVLCPPHGSRPGIPPLPSTLTLTLSRLRTVLKRSKTRTPLAGPNVCDCGLEERGCYACSHRLSHVLRIPIPLAGDNRQVPAGV